VKIVYGSNFRAKEKKKGNADRRADTLCEIGHQVVRVDFLPHIYRFGTLGARSLHHLNFLPCSWSMNRELLSACVREQPDVVWLDKGKFISGKTIQKIKEACPGAQVVHYNPDDPFGLFHHNWNIFKRAIPFYDLHFVPNEISIEDYRAFSAKRIEIFDRSFDPNIHRPLQLNAEDLKRYEVDVGFIGSWASHREKMIAELILSGIPVAVYGANWQKGKHWDTIKPHYRGGSLWGDEYAKAICGMKVALHFLRKENRDDQDSRTFEIPACGSFMLAEYSPKHIELFEAGKEAVFFEKDGELEKLVRHFLQNPEERERISAAGRDRCLKSGYYHEKRMKELLSRI